MSKLLHNLVKIKYINEGFLPNYPYHLISDGEMCEAFLSRDEDKSCFFNYNYPLPTYDLSDEYAALVRCIRYHIDKLLASTDDVYTLPDWVYSYMLGSVISDTSSIADKHDMFVLMDMDNVDDVYTPSIAQMCYRLSCQWMSKLSFEKKFYVVSADETIPIRVPSMFGEPHVLKYLRLRQVEVN